MVLEEDLIILLKELIAAPIESSSLIIADPFNDIDRDFLLKEVIGLANAEVEGPRYILFGVNPSGVEGSSVVGVSPEAMTQLKRSCRLVSAFVDPGLDLAFMFDSINGKLGGALEIDGCNFGPYFLAEDLSDELQRGACWRREGRDLVPIERSALMSGGMAIASEETPEPEQDAGDVHLSIGFESDAELDFLEVDVADTSDPPFSNESGGAGKTGQTPLDFTQTMVGKLLEKAAKRRESDSPEDRPDSSPDTGATDSQALSMQVAESARKHYYLEERAARIEIFLRNHSSFDVNDLTVEIGFPRVPGFEIAHRLYPNPFDKSSQQALRNLRYPEVSLKDQATIVSARIDSLSSASSCPLFRTPLRIAVGPESLGRKIALDYRVKDSTGQQLIAGRLKMRLGSLSAKAAGQAEEREHKRNVDEQAPTE